MSEQSEQWEYCQIEAQVVHDGRGHSAYSGAPPNYWFKFIANGTSNGQPFVAGKSEKIPIPSTVMVVKDSVPVQQQHGNFHAMLVTQLKKDGWESVGATSSQWWSQRFRRPQQERPSFLQKVKAFFN
jgi:hypothetical protein